VGAVPNTWVGKSFGRMRNLNLGKMEIVCSNWKTSTLNQTHCYPIRLLDEYPQVQGPNTALNPCAIIPLTLQTANVVHLYLFIYDIRLMYDIIYLPSDYLLLLLLVIDDNDERRRFLGVKELHN
jgi:hypothetical protein